MFTPMEIEDRFDNLDRRLDRIEQILPTLATTEDLRVYATKEDLRKALENYPTKADLAEALKNYPTKADLAEALKNYPTKADLAEALRNYATKADLTEALGQAFERAETTARILHEDLVGKIRMLGESRRKRR